LEPVVERFFAALAIDIEADPLAHSAPRRRGIAHRRESMAHTKRIAVLLMLVLAAQPFGAAAQTPSKAQETIREQLKKIHRGKSIEVTLLQGGDRKIRGKLISVGENSFDVRVEKSGRISSQRIEFASVKSVKKRGMSVAVKVLIIVGVAVVLGLTLYAARPGQTGT
jgi:hypothetical protein